MALSIGSIVSRCSMSKNDGLNPADRAYLDEYRRNSAVLLEVDSHLPPHPLSSKSKLSINPYHESFRAAQKQFLIQQAIVKRNHQISWNWKKTAILTAVLAIVITIIIVLACVFARDVSHGQYVQFFSTLILIMFASCFLIVIATKLHPWLSRTLLRKNCSSVSRETEETLTSSDEQITNPSVVVTVDEKSTK